MILLSHLELKEIFENKTVAIVGSAPSVLDNTPGLIDAHDLVVRVNNYKLSDNAGFRTDVHYSFYGSSIRKSKDDLVRDGVKFCVCKCPNEKIMSSPWHAKRMKLIGVDYRYIYDNRKDFWFCRTHIPDLNTYMQKFNLLGKRSPTTGFSAILDVISYEPKSIYVTGFDFFSSKLHNVDEKWKAGDDTDPIRHDHDAEREWLKDNEHLITPDSRLKEILSDD